MRRCLIPLVSVLVLGTSSAGTARAEGPTYAKDIALILWKNCAGCHRPGEVGPFSLLSYQDAAKRAADLVQVTSSREMPPWKPEPGFGEFHDVRRLTEAELKTIADWAQAGAPEGNPKDLPPPPKFAEGWQLGQPDLVLEAPAPFEIPASGEDVYRCFVIPIPIDADKTVAAVVFRPGNRKVVHHALFFLDKSGAARAKDEADAGPGYTSFGGPGILPSGGLGGWAPGAMPRKLPEGMGQMLRKGNDLVLQVHYHPDGKTETDRSTVGLYFNKTPARQVIGGLALRSRKIDIPAGDSRYHVTAETAPLPVDAKAVGIAPHMHFLGKEIKVVAETPDGKTVPMVWIKDWDFNWQGQYQYLSPIALPKGTVLKLDAYYDNSAANPRNPSTPPKRVGWGEQTTDEMCLVGVQMVADTPADLRKIIAMPGNGLGSILVGGDAAPRPAMKGLRKAMGGDGFLIPEPMKDRLGRFDFNKDGRLSTAEIEAMPEPAQGRLKAALRDRVMGAPIPKAEP